MATRYQERIDLSAITTVAGTPRSFLWRGEMYLVVRVLGHWFQDADGWIGHTNGDVSRELWRISATKQDELGHETQVVELSRIEGKWRLERVWD